LSKLAARVSIDPDIPAGTSLVKCQSFRAASLPLRLSKQALRKGENVSDSASFDKRSKFEGKKK
jgi:hypothetical protein